MPESVPSFVGLILGAAAMGWPHFFSNLKHHGQLAFLGMRTSLSSQPESHQEPCVCRLFWGLPLPMAQVLLTVHNHERPVNLWCSRPRVYATACNRVIWCTRGTPTARTHCDANAANGLNLRLYRMRISALGDKIADNLYIQYIRCINYILYIKYIQYIRYVLYIRYIPLHTV